MTLGIDIGGTTINLGLIDGDRILKKIQVPSFPKTATQEDTLIYLGDQIENFLVCFKKFSYETSVKHL